MKPEPTRQPSSNDVMLLQFGADDSMLNLLPVIALRPSRVLQLGGSTDALRTTIQALAQSPEFKGWQPKIQDLPASKDAPDFAAAREFMAQTLIANPQAIVNLSGGDRITSIAAHQAALLLGRPTLICDRERERFVDGKTGRFSRWPDYREAMKHLNLRVLMAAAGKNLNDWRGEQATDQLRTFGLKSFELRNKQSQALDAFNKALRAHFHGPSDKLPATPEELTALLAKPLPPSVSGSEPARQLLAHCVSAGLMKVENQAYRLNSPPVKRSVERSLQLISNAWIELAVFDCVLRNTRFREAQWNVTPVNAQNDSTDGDILCFDQQTSSIRTICCKAALDRPPQEIVDRFAARSARIGAGSSTLVVFKPAPGQEGAIRAVARNKGIDVALEADEIVKAFSPSVK